MHTVVTSSKPSDNPFVAGGGISYVGVTQSAFAPGAINGGAGRGYHTNWAFTDQLANQGTGSVAAGTLKFIAEVSGHENGHGLKLNHQSAYNGTTKTLEYADNGNSSAVAPIMGDSYGSTRGVWRNGATSTSTTIQNDVSLLLSNTGMGGFSDDGIGHSLAGASPLVLSGVNLATGANGGFITPTAAGGNAPIGENNYTRDYFSFNTAGGAVTLTINESNDLLSTGTADGGGMLDSVLRLLDSAGNILTSVTSPTSQVSTINTTLAAGQYYLQVASAGGKASTVTGSSNETASYFDYGSYFLSGSVPVPEPGIGLVAVVGMFGVMRRRRMA